MWTIESGELCKCRNDDACYRCAPEPPTTFHNTCDVRPSTLSSAHGRCMNHDLPVYRDGIDWCTLPVEGRV